jgi:hypothetical protein
MKLNLPQNGRMVLNGIDGSDVNQAVKAEASPPLPTTLVRLVGIGATSAWENIFNTSIGFY